MSQYCRFAVESVLLLRRHRVYLCYDLFCHLMPTFRIKWSEPNVSYSFLSMNLGAVTAAKSRRSETNLHFTRRHLRLAKNWTTFTWFVCHPLWHASQTREGQTRPRAIQACNIANHFAHLPMASELVSCNYLDPSWQR